MKVKFIPMFKIQNRNEIISSEQIRRNAYITAEEETEYRYYGARTEKRGTIKRRRML